MFVPKLRFKEFDGDWSSEKLGMLFSKRRAKGTEGLPTYSVTLNDGIVNREDLDRETVTNLAPDEHLLVKQGDLAYNMMRMWQGALGLAPTDGIVSPAYVVLKPDNKKTSSSFFEYYFKKNRQIHNFWAYSQGLTEDRLRLYFDDFKLIPINVPSKEEQTKISSFLSNVDVKINLLTQKHELLSQYKQGMMQKLFSQQIRFKANDGSKFVEWEEKKLIEIAYVTMGSSPKSENYNENFIGLPLLQGNADIKKRRSKPRIYTSEITKKCNVGDILLSVRAPVGYVAISDHNACIGRGLCSIHTKNSYSQAFLYQWLLSYELAWSSLSQGSTFDSVNSDQIKKIVFQLPCLEEQTKIANFLSNIDQKTEVVAQQIEQAKQWKKGLLQQMFV